MATGPVVAQELTIDWSRTAATGGVVLPGAGPDGTAALQLRAVGPTSFHLVTIERPPVTDPTYAVTGQVRYQGVEGQGYLEMWTVFPDGGRFFTRTLASQGPLAALHGESAWRSFELSFDLSGASQVPSRLEINLVLPARGTVWLGPLHLQRSSAPAAPTVTVQGGWWSERFGTLVGAILGSVVGVVGGIIGALGGRGKARRLVLTLLVGMIAVGGCLVLIAAAAASRSQPRHVWYPLLVIGGASAVIALVILPAMRRRYAADELRRIEAMDARPRA
jgi:hypothetical protein